MILIYQCQMANSIIKQDRHWAEMEMTTIIPIGKTSNPFRIIWPKYQITYKLSLNYSIWGPHVSIKRPCKSRLYFGLGSGQILGRLKQVRTISRLISSIWFLQEELKF